MKNIKLFLFSTVFLLQFAVTVAQPSSSLAFNGATQYMVVHNHADFHVNKGQVLSISFWIKPSIRSASQRIISKDFLGSSRNGYALSLNRAPIYMHVKGEGSEASLVLPNKDNPDGPSAVNGAWMHLGFVFDKIKNRVCLYKNGSLVISHDLTSQKAIDKVSDLYIACGVVFTGLAPGHFYKGEIGNLRFWKKELTEKDMNADMVAIVDASTLGLVAAYDFSTISNDGTNIWAADIMGKHPGKLYGFTDKVITSKE